MADVNSSIYSDDSIKSLEWQEHIRKRPGMYIGKLGDGSSPDDGIYVLLKEVIDNSIDEFVMGYGKTIEITVKDKQVSVRDYGRGIPLGKVIDCVAKPNTGAKYDSKVFKKSVGLNGIGTKAVNALSSSFMVKSVREGQIKVVEFSKGELVTEHDLELSSEKDGTIMIFTPDAELFGNYYYINEYIEKMLKNYAYLNNGLSLIYNGQKITSKNGLLDLLQDNIDSESLYPIIHIKDEDFEFAFTHLSNQYGEEYFSFVNGQHTTQGGTHQAAFREAFTKTVREFYKKDYEPGDIRNSMVAAISIKIQEPVFESQTKTKLGSLHIEPNGETIRNYVNNIVKKHLDNYLHINGETAEALLAKILQSEKERKGMADIKKLAKESAKKVSMHNSKLCDCHIHYNSNDERRLDTTLFITEGDSAGGSVTKVRDVKTQAVFKLKGKPMNCFGMTKKIIYDKRNEELLLLQAALNVDNDIDDLRYNNIVIATDADVDGMHIRLLLLTFFLQYYPEIVRSGHLYILQTPLFRVRNKKETRYCYTEDERTFALKELGNTAEITRFKGLGEISPEEFKHFIGAQMRLDPVILKKDSGLRDLLTFYMGKNTPERQNFIIENLQPVEV